MRRLNGFTLLEILIALFIFTIVSIMTTSALHSVLTSQSRTETSAERLSQIQIALTLISRDFVQVINRPITNVSGAQENAFIGSQSSVTITRGGFANPLGQLTRSTLQRLRYRVNNHHLIRETWPVLDPVSGTRSASRILLNQVDDLQFEYLDQNNHFHNRWPPADQVSNVFVMPKAVKISISLSDLGMLSQLYVIPIQQKNTQPK